MASGRSPRPTDHARRLPFLPVFELQRRPDAAALRGARVRRPRDRPPRVAIGIAAEQLDSSLVQRLAQVGFLGATWSDELGGSGLDTVSYTLIVEELGKADSSVRGIVSVNVGLVGKTIDRFGSDAQRREWLPLLASGRGARLLCAHRAGLRVRRCSAADAPARDGDDWVLSGSKTFITLGSWAAVALVFRAHRRRGCTRDHLFSRPDDSQRLQHPSDQGKTRPSCTGHRRARVRRRPGARRVSAR